MATWLNHVAIAAPRNGTTTHTVDPSTGTVVTGALFTPTAGNFLVCVVEGDVTTFGSAAGTPPTGWTLPAGGSAVNFSGLYVFTKTAVGADAMVANHNGSNYPCVFHFFEYAAGSTLIAAAAAWGNPPAGATTPTLTGLTGTHHDFYVVAMGVTPTTATGTNSYTWSPGTKLVDTLVLGGGSGGTDGYAYSLAYTADATATTSAGGTYTRTGTMATVGTETLSFAVNIAASAPVTVYPSRPRVARYPTMRAAVI